MAHHMTTSMIVTLLTICASMAARPSRINKAGDPVEGDARAGVDSLFNDVVEVHSSQTVVCHKNLGDELATLGRLPVLMAQLQKEIDNIKNLNDSDNTIIVKHSMFRERNFQRTLDSLADQLNIQNMVKEYNRIKDWQSLRKGLEAVLDHDSTAYKQLQAISWSDQSPWHHAFEGHIELVSVLVFAGHDIDARDRNQNNLLHKAVSGGQKEIVEMLLDNGADIESRNAWGNAPLALACKYGHLELARLLWARGAKVDGINYDEKWAGLARAADEGYLEIVKFMVKIGASTTIKDRDGRTPLEIARRKGHTAIMEYLIQFPH